MTPQDLIARFDELAEAPDGISSLRGLVLEQAYRGLLGTSQPRNSDADGLAVLSRRAEALKHKPGRRSKVDTDAIPSALFAVPDGWIWSPLEASGAPNDVAFSDGPFGSALKTEHYVPRSSCRVIRLGNIGRGVFDRSKEAFVSQAHFDDLARYHTRPRDVIVASLGDPPARACSVPSDLGPALVKADCFRVRVDETLLLVEYVVGWLNAPSMANLGRDLARGDTRGRITIGHLKALPIPVPPLAEQKRIVARVDELMKLIDQLDAARTRREQARVAFRDSALSALQTATTTEEVELAWARVRERFDELITADDAGVTDGAVRTLAVRGLLGGGSAQLNKDMSGPFVLPAGWKWVTLDDVVDPERPIGYGVLVPGAHEPDGIPLVRVAELDAVNPTPRPEKAISATVAAQYERTRLRGDELLLGVVGSIGKVGVAHPQWRGAVIARAVARIAVRADVERAYVLLVLQSPFMQAHFRDVTRTLAQPTLNVGLIRAAPFPLPPLEAQRAIAANAQKLLGLSREVDVALAAANGCQSSFAAAAVHHLDV